MDLKFSKIQKCELLFVSPSLVIYKFLMFWKSFFWDFQKTKNVNFFFVNPGVVINNLLINHEFQIFCLKISNLEFWKALKIWKSGHLDLLKFDKHSKFINHRQEIHSTFVFLKIFFFFFLFLKKWESNMKLKIKGVFLFVQKSRIFFFKF